MHNLDNIKKFFGSALSKERASIVDDYIDNLEFLHFSEQSYLECHGDVADAVKEGSIRSGYQHWVVHGEKEGRNGSGLSPHRDRMLGPRENAGGRLKVVLYAPISAVSGLGTAARGYAAVLKGKDWDLEVIDSTACLYPHRQFDPILVPSQKADVVIIHHNPDALPSFFRKVDRSILDNTYVVGIWVWELSSFPMEWVDSFGAVDEVWVPSEFCAQAVRSSAPSAVPVHVIPHVVEPYVPEMIYERSHFGIPEKSFAFLYMFDVSSFMVRKNPIVAVKAFKRAFGDDPSTVLVLKYHSSSSDISAVRKLMHLATGTNVIFLDDMYSSDKVHSLKHVCDCFVSPHRAEGFGLNIAEAMLMDKPVVATGYSGSSDFLTEETGFPVRYKLTEVAVKGTAYPPRYVWADPDIDHLAEQMRVVRQGGELVEARIAKAHAMIVETLSSEAVARRVNERLATYPRLVDNRPLGGDTADMLRLNNAWRHPISFLEPDEAARVRELGASPKFSVIVPVYNIAPHLLEACVRSVIAQSYPYWELCLCDDASTSAATLALLESLRGLDQRIKVRRLAVNQGISRCTNKAVEFATGDYLAFLDNDDTIAPDALFRYAEAIVRDPKADLLYCDEDKIDFNGRFVDHYFKPDWSPEHLESCMYVLHMLVVRKPLFLEIGGYRPEYTGAQDYDFALRLSALGAKIVHVPYVLYHWRMIAGSASAQVDAKPQGLANAKAALEDYAATKYGADALVEDGELQGLFRVRHGRELLPPVTLVITTNNVTKAIEGRGTINLPGHFLQSIAEKTDYPNYRVLVVSNGALDEKARQTLSVLGGDEIVYTGSMSPFNFPDKANFSIRSAETDVVVLLNDDLEVRSSGWLRALVEPLQNREVGAVGCRLLYPNGRIQHAGVVLGVNRTTAHIYHGHPGDTIGYNGFPRLIRNYSAVTGACMATRRSLFNAVGGFDPCFPVDFNDTDYCLKLRELDFRVVYTPFCELVHFESQTAVRTSQDPGEVERFLSRWQAVLDRDPYYNPNLSRSSITFEPNRGAWPVE